MARDSLIDEAVGQLAGYFTSILADRQVNKSARAADLLEQFGDYLKSSVTPDTPHPLVAKTGSDGRRPPACRWGTSCTRRRVLHWRPD